MSQTNTLQQATISQGATGAHVSHAPLTTEVSDVASPGLLLNSIDSRIIKIRPMATPIDQLSRCAGSRHADSIKVDYYAVDVKDTVSTLSRAVQPDIATVGQNSFYISTKHNEIFSPTETIMLPASSVGESKQPLVLYIAAIDKRDGLLVVPVNAKRGENGWNFAPLTAGSPIVRMGRAAAELDVQSPQYEAVPRKATNYCQIFKMQIEQSTYQKLANKEVDWTLSDQEEVAIIDMRLGMEKNFIFGAMAEITDPDKNETVYLTGGIWNQTDNTFELPAGKLSNETMVSMCRRAFTGAGCGSTRKILVGGSGLIEKLSNMQADRNITNSNTLVKWGIEFREIRTNFGSLYVVHSEIFDQCGHPDDGMIIDPDALTKYSHVPFQSEILNLRSSGQRNTDARVLTECSCLVLRHPQSHLKIIQK